MPFGWTTGRRRKPEARLSGGTQPRRAGVLYVVATPIGNLEDLSARAIRILGEADLIACEDTRHTGHLLAAYAIRTPTISYFEHNEDRRTPELIERLLKGKTIALVSDADACDLRPGLSPRRRRA